MLTKENREKLLQKLSGHYNEVGASVGPSPVSGDFVRRVLKGTKTSAAVERAAVKYGEKLDREVEVLNQKVEQLKPVQ